jgi:hypothetical protein
MQSTGNQAHVYAVAGCITVQPDQALLTLLLLILVKISGVEELMISVKASFPKKAISAIPVNYKATVTASLPLLLKAETPC